MRTDLDHDLDALPGKNTNAFCELDRLPDVSNPIIRRRDLVPREIAGQIRGESNLRGRKANHARYFFEGRQNRFHQARMKRMGNLQGDNFCADLFQTAADRFDFGAAARYNNI